MQSFQSLLEFSIRCQFSLQPSTTLGDKFTEFFNSKYQTQNGSDIKFYCYSKIPVADCLLFFFSNGAGMPVNLALGQIPPRVEAPNPPGPSTFNPIDIVLNISLDSLDSVYQIKLAEKVVWLIVVIKSIWSQKITMRQLC